MKKKLLSISIIAAVIIFLSLIILSQGMTKPVGHDEHMYCTAGYMTASGKLIYRDFSYVAQLPWHPMLLGAIYKITSTHYYLLTARLLSVAFEIGILICIAGIFKATIRDSLFYSTILPILATAIYSMNIFVIYSVGYAWNHSMVIFCVILSLWLFLSMDFSKVCKLRLIIAGALLSIAVFTRPTTFIVLLLFLAGIIVLIQGAKKRLQAVLLFTAGAATAAVWPVLIIIKAPKAFFLNVIKIPVLNAQLLHKIGLVYDKTALTISAIKSPCYLVILITLLVMIGGMAIHRKKMDSDIKRKSLFCLLLTAVMFSIIFIPPTMWPQYWAMPVGFILISFALFTEVFCRIKIKNHGTGIWFRTSFYLIAACATVSIIYGLAVMPDSMGSLFHTDQWVPIKVHNISKDIVSRSGNKPIMTLSPLYAIEGSGEIFEQFSAGPFVYRVADELSEDEKKALHAVGTNDIEAFIKSRKPNAIILGTEHGELEEPIVKCIDGQWQIKGYGQGEPVVYFK